ncbi:hypothetical protein D3C86_1271580 [compost metagenome]
MRERTILTVVINFQVPNDCSQKYNRAFDEKIALLLYPAAIEVQHYRICCFVSIRDIRHEIEIKRIATVALSGVIKVDDIEFWLYFVFIAVLQ